MRTTCRHQTGILLQLRWGGSAAFLGNTAKLTWHLDETSESLGRGNLFVGAFMAYRNHRAHREPMNEPAYALDEFLLLNHLFCLERQALDVAKS